MRTSDAFRTRRSNRWQITGFLWPGLSFQSFQAAATLLSHEDIMAGLIGIILVFCAVITSLGRTAVCLMVGIRDPNNFVSYHFELHTQSIAMGAI